MDILAAVAFQQTPLPVGVTYHHTSVDLIDSNANVVLSQTIDPNVGTVTFTNITPGDYTVKVQSFDTNGKELGASVSGSITVPTPATFPEPTSVTLSVQ